MKLINKEDIKYIYCWGRDGLTECAIKANLDAIPEIEAIDGEALFLLATTLNQRALNTYKKAVKSRQTYDIVGDPAEKDKALRYEGYADGLTKAVHCIEEIIDRKVEE